MTQARVKIDNIIGDCRNPNFNFVPSLIKLHLLVKLSTWPTGVIE
jgi:hypothetical protein